MSNANAPFSVQLENLRLSMARLSTPQLQARLDTAISMLYQALAGGKPVLACGNGGSAADSQHIAGELVGKFLVDRKALNVRALSTDTSVITAWANDVGYDTVFARQVEAYGQASGVLWAISTSGNSRNVILAAESARALGMGVLALTGEGGGKLAAVADVLIDVPSTFTPRVQEMHVMLYHYICEQIEIRFN